MSAMAFQQQMAPNRVDMMMRKLLCLALTTLLYSSLGYAENAPPSNLPVVIVGTLEFPPFTYSDAEGHPKGSMIELCKRLLHQAGYQGDFHSLPSARLYASLLDGSVHVWPGAPGKTELQGYVLEGRATLGKVDLMLYFRPDTRPPKLPEDLAGRTVLLISGYGYWKPYSDWLSDPTLNVRVNRPNSHTSALEMLLRQRGDFLLDYHAPVEQARQDLGMAELPHMHLHRLTSKMIVSKRAPNAEALRDALDRAYAELKAAGENLRLPEDHSDEP